MLETHEGRMGRQVQNVLCVREVSRILVRASDSSMEPHVLAVSNLDLVPQRIQGSLFCMYPKPPSTTTGGFDAVVDAFRSGLPSLLNHFFPLAGRLVTNPISGLPEVDCGNQGAELVVGEAASSALSSLDYGAIGPLKRAAQLPYAEDVALSVQVVSFACGGFTVAWCSHHVLMDGGALTLLVRAWSELARSGTLFRPRRPPSYGAWLHEWFTPLDPARQVNVLTLERSLVERLYRVDASVMARLRDAATGRATETFSAYLWKVLARVVGPADARCRMGWWVDGRHAAVADPARNYMGNFVTYTSKEAGVEEVLAMPLRDVAALVREAVSAPAYDERFQELVDWVEEHKPRRYIETAVMGMGSPAVSVTMFSSFRINTDFGFGHAALALPTVREVARIVSGYVQTCSQPGRDDGSLIVNALVWPRLADALEGDPLRIFRPVTAEFLGFVAPQDQQRSPL